MKTYMEQVADIVGKKVYIRRPCGATYGIHVAAPKRQPEVAQFSLRQLSGCCGVCVSFHAHVSVPYRNNGLGTLLNKMRQQIAWDDGYTVLLCTDVESNQFQKKILTKNEWLKLFTFKNRRTQHEVCLHAIVLQDTGIKVDDDSTNLSPSKD